MTKEEIKIYQELIDECDHFSLVQKSFLKKVLYFTETNRGFTFNLEKEINKFDSEVRNDFNVESELNLLFDGGFLLKKTKRKIYLGSYITVTNISINTDMLITLIKSIADNNKKQEEERQKRVAIILEAAKKRCEILNNTNKQ